MYGDGKGGLGLAHRICFVRVSVRSYTNPKLSQCVSLNLPNIKQHLGVKAFSIPSSPKRRANMPMGSAFELGWRPCAPANAGWVGRAVPRGKSDAVDGNAS